MGSSSLTVSLLQLGLLDQVRIMALFELAAEALRVARWVFATRATHDLPQAIPDPPASWSHTYATLAADLDVQAATIPEAMARLNEFWAVARATTDEAAK